MSSTRSISSSIHEGDDVSLYTVGEETVMEMDENGNVVKKKKKFRKLRKSLSKGRRSLRNLFSSPPGSSSKRNKLDDASSVISEETTSSVVSNKKSQKAKKKMKDVVSSSERSEYQMSGNNLANSDAERDMSLVDNAPVVDLGAGSPALSNQYAPTSSDDEKLDLVGKHDKVINATVQENMSEVNTAESIDLIQVMLLVIDPLSGRFEVIQLDLDLERAIVTDLIAQIPQSVTAPSLKELSFVGTFQCQPTSNSSDIKTMKNCHYLKAFGVKKDEVLIAVPENQSTSETWEMAVPILSNPRIATILHIPKIVVEKKKENETNERKRNSLVVEEPNKLEKEHTNKEESNDSRMINSNKKISSKFILTIKVFALIVSVFLLILSAVIDVQMKITSPLSPGDVLEGGEWRSQCGLLRIIPHTEEYFGCHPMTLEFGRDGVLSLFDSMNENRKLIWEIRSGNNSDALVEPILVIADDGSITIGGVESHITFLDNDGSAPFTPWPFAQDHNVFPQNRKKQQRRFLGIFPLP